MAQIPKGRLLVAWSVQEEEQEEEENEDKEKEEGVLLFVDWVGPSWFVLGPGSLAGLQVCFLKCTYRLPQAELGKAATWPYLAIND